MTETFTREELIERAEKAEAEVATLLARLQSTESALDRAMARSNSWREEAAKLQAQMLADQGQHVARAATTNAIRRPYGRDDRRGKPVEMSRGCYTCAHIVLPMLEEPCRLCAPALGSMGYPNWTPKPIPSTTDKGENP